MNRIRVRIPSSRPRSYSIQIGTGLLARIPQQLRREPIADRYLVLTDRKVEPLYGTALRRRLRRAGLRADLFVIPAGERTKTRRTKERVEDAMAQFGLGRDAALIAIGGGVVGDLGGFVAATYCRGIPVVQVPTTLLGMVDSAVGGKTGVDHPRAKNWIGAVWQPAAVIADIDTLTSLPERTFRSGLAEVIKTALIADAKLFRYLESNLPRIRARDPVVLARIVNACCRIKGRIVERDETESDLRKILNFGHTIGHALENLSGYRLAHGEAVAIGMVAEARLAVKMGLLSKPDAYRLEVILCDARLPVTLPRGSRTDRILKAAVLDKKTRQGRPEYALPAAIGRMATRKGRHAFSAPDRTIRAVLTALR